MKRLMFIAVYALVFTACGDSKSKESDSKSTSSTATTETKPAATGDDAMLTSWLGGKMLNSTKKEPKMDMYDHLKLNADGSCSDKDNSSAKWKVENGEFSFIASMTLKNKIEKKNDSTVIFHGTIGDDIYTLSPIK